MNTVNNEKLLDDIIAFLDGSVANGAGHLNVEVLNTSDDAVPKRIDTLGCTDCAKGNVACRVPTLHDGIDEKWNRE